jgi:hypothetical protein
MQIIAGTIYGKAMRRPQQQRAPRSFLASYKEMESPLLVAADQLSPSRTACFAVPFERDSKFIGREELIAQTDR